MSSPVTLEIKTPKAPQGGVWDYFLYDTVTKYGTCKYCNKRYKRNATRMAEHLKQCTPFLTSNDSKGVELKVVRKSMINRPSFVHEDVDSSSVDNTNDGVGIDRSGTLSLDSQLISVEHGYNSDYIKTVSHSRNRDDTYFQSNNPLDESRDEFLIFGEHVAVELRKLKQQPILLAETKYELNKVLHKSLMECLKREEYVSVYVE